MDYLPLFLDVSGRPCIVIGDGEIAVRRVRALLKAGARVTVISRDATMEAFAEAGKIHHLRREYTSGDLKGFVLAYVVTLDFAVARAAAAEASEAGIPINVADAPELCSFLTPAVVRRGGLQVAISTGGSSPALAKLLRDKFESMLGSEYSLLLEVMGAARRRLKLDQCEAEVRARILNALAASDLRECLGRRDLEGANRILIRHIGCGMTELGFDGSRVNSILAGNGPGVTDN